MQIAVCDDNEMFLQEIREQLQTLSLVGNIFLFSNLNAFLFSIEEGKRYDVILLDIDWNRDRVGMEVAEELYKLCPETKIIYVTGHNDRYIQHIFLYRANLNGYLTKPVDMELLQANLQKAAAELPYQEQPALVLRQRGAPVSIPWREIYFIESRGHTIEVHTGEETVIAYDRLGNILRSLPVGFYQCHKSYIVNLRQIRRFQASDILLKNGERVPVSRARYTGTKEAYFSFMGQSF